MPDRRHQQLGGGGVDPHLHGAIAPLGQPLTDRRKPCARERVAVGEFGMDPAPSQDEFVHERVGNRLPAPWFQRSGPGGEVREWGPNLVPQPGHHGRAIGPGHRNQPLETDGVRLQQTGHQAVGVVAGPVGEDFSRHPPGPRIGGRGLEQCDDLGQQSLFHGREQLPPRQPLGRVEGRQVSDYRASDLLPAGVAGAQPGQRRGGPKPHGRSVGGLHGSVGLLGPVESEFPEVLDRVGLLLLEPVFGAGKFLPDLRHDSWFCAPQRFEQRGRLVAIGEQSEPRESQRGWVATLLFEGRSGPRLFPAGTRDSQALGQQSLGPRLQRLVAQALDEPGPFLGLGGLQLRHQRLGAVVEGVGTPPPPHGPDQAEQEQQQATLPPPHHRRAGQHLDRFGRTLGMTRPPANLPFFPQRREEPIPAFMPPLGTPFAQQLPGPPLGRGSLFPPQPFPHGRHKRVVRQLAPQPRQRRLAREARPGESLVWGASVLRGRIGNPGGQSALGARQDRGGGDQPEFEVEPGQQGGESGGIGVVPTFPAEVGQRPHGSADGAARRGQQGPQQVQGARSLALTGRRNTLGVEAFLQEGDCQPLGPAHILERSGSPGARLHEVGEEGEPHADDPPTIGEFIDRPVEEPMLFVREQGRVTGERAKRLSEPQQHLAGVGGVEEFDGVGVAARLQGNFQPVHQPQQRGPEIIADQQQCLQRRPVAVSQGGDQVVSLGAARGVPGVEPLLELVEHQQDLAALRRDAARADGRQRFGETPPGLQAGETQPEGGEKPGGSVAGCRLDDDGEQGGPQGRDEARPDQRRFSTATGAVHHPDGGGQLGLRGLDELFPDADAFGQSLAVARPGEELQKELVIARVERPQPFRNHRQRRGISRGGGGRGREWTVPGAEVAGEIGDGGVAVGLPAGEAAEADAFEFGGNLGAQFAGRARGLGADLVENLFAGPPERGAAREQFIEHHAQAPGVGATVEAVRLATGLLG